ncbi:hypothetical protein [Aquabacterium sp. J223]|uniref:hypothetical protein n=1 Tax=Aquabacterium sp. J223 TaxID=2898431 RepID=UPI0021ADC46D|nr:hypothetical protein [Aquabacterium sp. J223]UUX95026.1 hypothetical protein LRS07_17525 [Aquabacterium sp. J223]
MVWLVFALPAAAVVASVGTAVVALARPDPVIAVAAGRTPAVQGRNHAATPGATAPRR